MRKDHETVIPSVRQGSAKPIVTICLDGQYVNYGVNTRLIRRLSAGERDQILATVREILLEEK